eukprot:TRINITY_DN14931_c0_g1_i3.p2 TRINITY_DN14931_c0_g1~~TRINITY_DN14931_c0_g1_i3.p2  ORF type:complete len:172 (+),score=64.59 TRINITY_DN14931_c0_g1_i3:338-853(+)
MPSSHFIRGASFSESDEDEEEESEEDEESDEEEAGLLQGAASTPTSAKPTSAGPLKLHDDPNIEPPEFQKKWGQLTTSETLQLRFKSIPSLEKFEEHLEEFNIFTMAEGKQGGTTKVYLYGQPAENENAHFLIELLIQATATGQATIRSDDKRLKEFVAVFKKAISGYCTS